MKANFVRTALSSAQLSPYYPQLSHQGIEWLFLAPATKRPKTFAQYPLSIAKIQFRDNAVKGVLLSGHSICVESTGHCQNGFSIVCFVPLYSVIYIFFLGVIGRRGQLSSK